MIIRELLEADGKSAGVQTDPQAQTATQAQTAAQKKYDDDEVNAILARNKEKYAKEGVTSILSTLGFDSADALKDFVAKQKGKEIAGLSQEEKIKAEFEEFKAKVEAEKNETVKKLTLAETKAAILASGIPADKADKVMKLAAGYDGDSPEEKVKAVLADFPELISKAPANAGIKTGNQAVDENAAALEAFKKQHGYTK